MSFLSLNVDRDAVIGFFMQVESQYFMFGHKVELVALLCNACWSPLRQVHQFIKGIQLVEPAAGIPLHKTMGAADPQIAIFAGYDGAVLFGTDRMQIPWI